MHRQMTIALPRQLHPGKARALARRITSDWREQAVCASAKDCEAWFPNPATAWEFLAEPLSACAACPVRRSCLAAALLGDEAGLWAGTDRADRRPAHARLAAGAVVDLVLDELLYKARVRAKEVS